MKLLRSSREDKNKYKLSFSLSVSTEKNKKFISPFLSPLSAHIVCSLEDGIEQQLTPPTPPPRRNLPSTGAAITFATGTSGNAESSSATTSRTPSPTLSPSPSFASSSNEGAHYYAYATRGCCPDTPGWKQQHAPADGNEDNPNDIDKGITSNETNTRVVQRKRSKQGSSKRSSKRSSNRSKGSSKRSSKHREGSTDGKYSSVRSRKSHKSDDDDDTKAKDCSHRERSIANGLKLAQTQAIAVAGFFADVDARQWRVCESCLSHRASFHGRVSWAGESNGGVGSERLSHSLPGSPSDRKPNFEVIGSAESLVGRVLAEQGLGKYCDQDFVRYTSREMQEALDMTREEMDRAAHQLLLRERRGQPLTFQLQQSMDQHWNPRPQGPREVAYEQLREQMPSLEQPQLSLQPQPQQQQQQQMYREQPPS